MTTHLLTFRRSMSNPSSGEKSSSTKSRRNPGKPGRFDPDRPLEMTTRRAARVKLEGANGTALSATGSVEDDASRNGSIDELRPTTSHSRGSLASLKSRASSPCEDRDVVMTGAEPVIYLAQATESVVEPEVEIHMSSPKQRSATASPSRKRKRSASPPASPRLFITPSPQPDAQAIADDDNEHAADRDDLNMSQADPKTNVEDVEMEDGDYINTNALRQHSNTVKLESDTQSIGQQNAEAQIAAPSTDITPAGSLPRSPASSLSDAADTPLAKAQAEYAESPSRVSFAAGNEALEEHDEADGPAKTDEEGRPKRRKGGRRRAPHADRSVDKALKRQDQLRSDYRSIARELKRVLAEATERTIDELTTKPIACEEAAEHEAVMAGLDAALAKRQAQIRMQQEQDMRLLKVRLEDEAKVARSNYQLRMIEEKDQRLDKLEHDLLVIARAAQEEFATNDVGTEDEDDVIPRPKRASYRYKRGEALGTEYDSRSRLAMETEDAVDEVQRQFVMRKLLQEHLPADARPKVPETFAVMYPAAREAAVEKQFVVASLNTLTNAANEVERIASIPIIPNREAVGLQMLGELACRPSITATHARSKKISAAKQIHHRPQPLQLSRPPSQQAGGPGSGPRHPLFGYRPDPSMPPPRTPREEINVALKFSPKEQRVVEPLQSPRRQAGDPMHWFSDIAANARNKAEPKPLREPESPHSTGERPRADSAPHRRGPSMDSNSSARGHTRGFFPLPSVPPWTARGLLHSEPARDQKLDVATGRPRGSSNSGSHTMSERHSVSLDERPKLPLTKPESGVTARSPSSQSSTFNGFHAPAEIEAMARRIAMLTGRIPWPDQPSNPGATDRRPHPLPDPPHKRPIPEPANVPSASGMRKLSIDHQSPVDTVVKKPHKKTSKEERNGASRRAHGRNRSRKDKPLLNGPPLPPASTADFKGHPALGPFSRDHPPQPWLTSQHHPQSSLPPLPGPITAPPYYPSHHSTAAPPPGYPPASAGPPPPSTSYPHGAYDPQAYQHNQHQHRNSYPPRPDWSPPQPSPLYALPHGGPEHHYPHFGAPPPPQQPAYPQPHYRPPPYAAAASYAFGGPAIAPADARGGPQGYGGPGGPAAGVPAFAQQLGLGVNGRPGDPHVAGLAASSRRRTQSEVNEVGGRGWKEWHRPEERGRGRGGR